MKLSARIAAPVAALVLAGLTATACAPQTSDTSAKGDDKSGTLRVWLFQEVGNKPKEKVVDAAVAEFEKAHKGAEVEIEYIPVDTRAQRIKAAFNDPKSAPDLIEYGNSDTAGYVKDGGLADITEEFGAWDEAKDTDPIAKQSVTVGDKVYGAPFFVGVRALYYRTDVFKDLGIDPPKSQAELISTAKKIRKAKPDLYGLAVGGAYTYGAMPFIWANGGELAGETGGTYKSGINSEKSRKGIEAYTSLFGDDNCPAAKCASMGGNATVTAFASGKAAMAIGGDFSHAAVEAGARSRASMPSCRCPASRRTPSPRPSRAEQPRCPQEQFAPHPRRRPDEVAVRQEDPGPDVRRDGLPAHLHRRPGQRREEGALRRSVRRDPRRGRQVRPRLARLGRSTPRWSCRRCSRRSSPAVRTWRSASDDAAKKMDAAFTEAG